MDNSSLRVSAIIPIFNAKETLRRAIDSLLIQPEIDQIILVDDGSTDGSLDIAMRYSEEYSQITLLRHPNGENRGAPASRNLGLKFAKNPWIQFMDADDELLPGKVKNQLDKISGDECLVVGEFTILGKVSQKSKSLRDIWAGLLSTRLGNTVANLWNKETLELAGGWDESLPNVQEYHLMFEMLKINTKVAFSNKNLVRLFPQPNSITNSSNRKLEKRDTYFRFRNSVRDYLIQQNLYSLKRKHYYTVSTGNMLAYHKPPFQVHFDNQYFWLYKQLKSLKF